MSTAVGGAFVVWGLAAGLVALRDDSFLTHLATGRLILAHGVPTTDPYSFTAHGHPWIVESWLASVLYGLVERAGGGHGLVLLHGALAAVLAGITWSLTRPARALFGRVLATGAVLAVGTGYWSPRPLLIALVLFGVVMILTERDAGSPWLAVPVLWLWVNVHGSWPFGLAYLALRLVGRALERRPLGRLPRLLGAAVLGAALGGANPIGPRLLTYPLVVLSHHQAFSHVAEWQSPDLANPTNAVFLAEVVLAAVLVIVRRRGADGAGRLEDGLVTVAFAASALLASRNVPVAALVVAPVLARGLAGLGTIDGERRDALSVAATVGLVAVGALLVVGALGRPAYNLSGYPVAEVTWMQARGLVPGRVVAPDYVGNYLEFRYGTRADVFVDDRVDMFPATLEQAYETLLTTGPGWQAVLTRYRAQAVLWPRADRLAALLAHDPHWEVLRQDRHWIVAVPRP